jgi:uncharacterized protein (TIGR00266 family)
MQYVEIVLDPGEACVAEAGAFFYMDPGIQMETIFGDGSSASSGGGLMGKLLSAGKRVLTGESLFMTVFSNAAGKRQRVSFAAPYPGRVLALDLKQLGGTMLCQKDAFLCAAKGISIGIAFQKRLGAGLFGGEGFILQKLEGDGLAFVHACGTIVERELAAGETLRVDTGCLVAFEPRVGYDIQMVKGVKTFLFGGEGLFFATVTGPGRVWLRRCRSAVGARPAYAPQAGRAARARCWLIGNLLTATASVESASRSRPARLGAGVVAPSSRRSPSPAGWWRRRRGPPRPLSRARRSADRTDDPRRAVGGAGRRLSGAGQHPGRSEEFSTAARSALECRSGGIQPRGHVLTNYVAGEIRPVCPHLRRGDRRGRGGAIRSPIFGAAAPSGSRRATG